MKLFRLYDEFAILFIAQPRPFINHIKAAEKKRARDAEKTEPNTPAPKVKTEPKGGRRAR